MCCLCSATGAGHGTGALFHEPSRRLTLLFAVWPQYAAWIVEHADTWPASIHFT